MASETILIVEDNANLLQNNCEYLARKEYAVEGAATLATARQALSRAAFDLVLLDVNLPDGEGFELEADVPPHTAILYLTGRTEEEDVVRGLSREGGRVDYLRKPFTYPEMGARVKALLAAGRQRVAATVTQGPLTLDVVAGRAFVDGKDMLLTQKEFALLLVLAQNERRTLPKEALYEPCGSNPWPETATR